MRRDYIRAVRSLGVTLVVAATIGGGVLAAAWSLQAAALPVPERADFVAARAAGWFLQYRLVESAFRVGTGPLIHGSCLQGWFPTRAGPQRGTVLRLDNGTSIVAVRPHHVDVVGAARPLSARRVLVDLELAGCPRIVGPRIAQQLQNGPRERTERAYAAGRPALALRVPTMVTRIVVYLAPKTIRPVAVAVRSGRLSGYSRIRLTPLTPALWRSLVAGPRRSLVVAP
jgi:hypothetical protein